MSIPFFYEPYDDTSLIVLSDASSHHAIHVLRMKVGDLIYVTNGKGLKSLCKISHTSKKECSIDLIETTFHEAPNPSLHMAIAFTKNPSRIEWFLEKATEIGIQTITPLITKRSEKIHFKKDRFEKILVSAMLQSKQVYLPHLNEATLIDEVIEGDEELKLIAHCEEDGQRIHLNHCIEQNKNTLILIGPEGDFTPEEIHLCFSKNCQPVLLGNNRLRTETAGLFACVVFNAQIATI